MWAVGPLGPREAASALRGPPPHVLPPYPIKPVQASIPPHACMRHCMRDLAVHAERRCPVELAHVRCTQGTGC